MILSTGLTLALLAYVAVVFTIHVPWFEVAQRIVWPQLAITRDSIMMIVAVFGTTISPYLFFWQAAQEMEDLRAHHQAGAPITLEAAITDSDIGRRKPCRSAKRPAGNARKTWLRANSEISTPTAAAL